MSAQFEDSLLEFDLDFLNQTSNKPAQVSETPEEKNERVRKSWLLTKKKLVTSDTLIRQFYTAKEQADQMGKELQTLKEDYKHSCIEFKETCEKLNAKEQELQTLHKRNVELQEKYEQSQNIVGAMQSHANQLQLLVKENETKMESLKIENKLQNTNSKDHEKKIFKLQKENEELLRCFSQVADIVFRKKKLNKHRKEILLKYYKKHDSDDNDSSFGEQSSGVESDTETDFSTILCSKENTERSKKLKNKGQSVKSKDNNDHDSGINAFASPDTGRASSLAFSDGDKFFNSPDYFVNHSPISADIEGSQRIMHVNTATSPIHFIQTVHAATSPHEFEDENVQTGPVNIDIEKVHVDTATSPIHFFKPVHVATSPHKFENEDVQISPVSADIEKVHLNTATSPIHFFKTVHVATSPVEFGCEDTQIRPDCVDIEESPQESLVNTRTSPIHLIETLNEATSPTKLEYEDIQIILSPMSTHDMDDFADIVLDPIENSDVTELAKAPHENSIELDIDHSKSPSNNVIVDSQVAAEAIIDPDNEMSIDEVNTVPVTIPKNNKPEDSCQSGDKETLSEKDCLELNNSNNLQVNSVGDCEIEMILHKMQLHHTLITPIPNSPSKSSTTTSANNTVSKSSHEVSENSCNEAAISRKENKILQAKVAELSQEILKIKEVLRINKMLDGEEQIDRSTVNMPLNKVNTILPLNADTNLNRSITSGCGVSSPNKIDKNIALAKTASCRSKKVPKEKISKESLDKIINNKKALPVSSLLEDKVQYPSDERISTGRSGDSIKSSCTSKQTQLVANINYNSLFEEEPPPSPMTRIEDTVPDCGIDLDNNHSESNISSVSEIDHSSNRHVTDIKGNSNNNINKTAKIIRYKSLFDTEPTDNKTTTYYRSFVKSSHSTDHDYVKSGIDLPANDRTLSSAITNDNLLGSLRNTYSNKRKLNKSDKNLNKSLFDNELPVATDTVNTERNSYDENNRVMDTGNSDLGNDLRLSSIYNSSHLSDSLRNTSRITSKPKRTTKSIDYKSLFGDELVSPVNREKDQVHTDSDRSTVHTYRADFKLNSPVNDINLSPENENSKKISESVKNSQSSAKKLNTDTKNVNCKLLFDDEPITLINTRTNNLVRAECNRGTKDNIEMDLRIKTANNIRKPSESDEDSLPSSLIFEDPPIDETPDSSYISKDAGEDDTLIDKQTSLEDPHCKNIHKQRKLTKLEKMRQKLVPKSKIRKCSPSPTKRLHAKPKQLLQNPKPIVASDSAATLNDKDVYEKALKVMSELKSKELTKQLKTPPKYNKSIQNNKKENKESNNNNKINRNNYDEEGSCAMTIGSSQGREKMCYKTKTNALCSIRDGNHIPFDKELVIAVVKCDDNLIGSLSPKKPIATRNQALSVKEANVSPTKNTIFETNNQMQINNESENTGEVNSDINEDIIQQSSRKQLKRVAVDKPDIPCKRMLRSSTLRQLKFEENSSPNSDNVSNSETVPKVDNSSKYGMIGKVSSIPMYTSTAKDILNYNDLDMFTSNENIPTKQVNDNKSKQTGPKDSILCAMVDKFAKQNNRSYKKKIPESLITSTSEKIQDELVVIINTPTNEARGAMNKLVDTIRNWEYKLFMSSFMLYLKNPARKSELFNKISSPPAPPMTKSEQILIYVIAQLRGYWSSVDLVESTLRNIEYMLFKLNRTPDFDTIESTSHFYAVLCRYFKMKSRLRLFMLDAMYCIQFKAVPLIKQCLDVWMHVLPLAHMGVAKSPLVTCMVYLLHFYKCEDRFNRVQEIRNILNRKYFYEITEWNEPKIIEMFKNAINEVRAIPMEIKLLRIALIVIAKRHGARWCQNNIVKKLLLPMTENDVPERVKIFCISLLGPLLKPYPVDMKVHCEIVMNHLLDILKQNPSPKMQEAVITSLIYMSKHNYMRVLQTLLDWKTQHISPELEGILRDFVAEKPVKAWKTVLSKIQLT